MYETRKTETSLLESNDINPELVTANQDKWASSLLSKKPEQVATLYSAEATFLPTASGEFKKGQSGAQEYFKHFLEKDPSSEVTEEKITVLDSDHYLHNGKYKFAIGPSDARETIEAEFSFVWERNDEGEWKIIHHHSSLIPKQEDFANSLETNPSSEITEGVVQPLGPDHYLQSGLYDFEIGPDDDSKKIEARFSFVWEKDEAGKWRIIHRHYSIKPVN